MPTLTTPTPHPPGPQGRAARVERRNQRLRDAFYARYTNQPRGRKPERAAVVQALADACYLSVATVERILLPKG